MATATATECCTNDFFNLTKDKQINVGFWNTWNESFSGTGSYEHVTLNNHLTKIAEISKCEIC